MGDFAYVKDGVTHVAQLPSAREEVVPGVCWDDPCALFSPAYWHTQYLMTRCLGPGEPTFRIATTFEEELTACVLGGHGIPAEVALAAFAHLREAGLIANLCADEVRIENELAKPIKLGERHVRYRFFAQK